MNADVLICYPSDNCRKIDVNKVEDKGKIIFMGIDRIDGIEVGINITGYTENGSQNSSNAVLSSEKEIDYSLLAKDWGIAFTSVIFFYIVGRVAGSILGFIKKEALD